MRWRSSQIGRVVSLAVVCGVLLAGCTPVVSEAKMTTNESLNEQREWVADQLDAAIAASGEKEGWYDIYFHDYFWMEFTSEDRAQFLGGIFPNDCGRGGSVGISLKNDTLSDGSAAADRVRAFWESEGWTVTDVYPDTRPEDNPYFRADREDGSLMSLRASSEGATVSVNAACSVHNTVTNWQHYEHDTSNPFAELQEQREQERLEQEAEQP